jgi:DNA-binding FrmR family transcriptional regulator
MKMFHVLMYYQEVVATRGAINGLMNELVEQHLKPHY